MVKRMLSGSVCTSQTAKSNILSLSDIYLLIVLTNRTTAYYNVKKQTKINFFQKKNKM